MNRIPSVFACALILVCVLPIALPAHAQTCTAPDPAIDAPVANDGGLVLRTLPLPTDTPGDLAWDGEALWVSDWQRGQLIRFDPERGNTLQRIEAPCYRPRGLEWHENLLYVADDFEGMIYVFDPASGRTLTRYATPHKGGQGLAWDGEGLWLAEAADGSLQRLIPMDGTALTYFPSPQRDPGGLAFDGKYLWVTQRMHDRIYMVDPVSGRAITSFDAPGPYPCGLAALPNGRLWVADNETGNLTLCAPRECRAYQTSDWREAEIEMIYRLENQGPGEIVDAAVHFAVPEQALENQTILDPLIFSPGVPERSVDQWGQSIATFRRDIIKPGERCEFSYRTRIKLANLTYIVIPDKVGTLKDVPADIRKAYTADSDRYRITTPLVSDTAKRLVGNETNVYWMVRNIYDWIIETMSYEMVGGWDVPETLIKRKTGSCSEYTFLFIALCRSAGIPARYEAGTVLRGDDASVDVAYHRWTEIYLPNYGWVPFDPQAGDQPAPGSQADCIGRIGNRIFVTTHGGGGSDALGWSYNSNAIYSFEGRCVFTEDAWISWRRAKEEGKNIVPSGAVLMP